MLAQCALNMCTYVYGINVCIEILWTMKVRLTTVKSRKLNLMSTVFIDTSVKSSRYNWINITNSRVIYGTSLRLRLTIFKKFEKIYFNTWKQRSSEKRKATLPTTTTPNTHAHIYSKIWIFNRFRSAYWWKLVVVVYSLILKHSLTIISWCSI